MNANLASSLGPWLALLGGSVASGLDGASTPSPTLPFAASSPGASSFARVLQALESASEGRGSGEMPPVVMLAPASVGIATPFPREFASPDPTTETVPAEEGGNGASPVAIEGIDGEGVASATSLPFVIAPENRSAAPSDSPARVETPSGSTTGSSESTKPVPGTDAVSRAPRTTLHGATDSVVATTHVATKTPVGAVPVAASESAPIPTVSVSPSLSPEGGPSVTMAAPSPVQSLSSVAFDATPAARTETSVPTTPSMPSPMPASAWQSAARIPATTVAASSAVAAAEDVAPERIPSPTPTTPTAPRLVTVPQAPISVAAPVDTATTEPAPTVSKPAASVSIPSRSIPAELPRASEHLRVEVETPRPSVSAERSLEMPRDFADWTRRVGEESHRAAPRPQPTTPVAKVPQDAPAPTPAAARVATEFQGVTTATAFRVAESVAPAAMPAATRERTEAPTSTERPVANLAELARTPVPAAPSSGANTSGERSDDRATPTPLPVHEAPAAEPTVAAQPVAPEGTSRPATPTLDLQISKAVAELAVKQEGDRLIASAAKGTVAARLQLQPAHLGELEIRVARREDGRLEITMRAAQASTQRGLEREVDRLVQALGRHELEVHQVQVRPLVVEASLPQDDARLPREGRSMQDPSPRDPRERTDSDVDSRSGRRRSRRHPGQFDAEA